MKFLKNGDTDLESLHKICGEIINIESGKILYRDGILIATDGKPIYHETPESKYSFHHSKGTIYIPSQWSFDEMMEFARVLFEILEDEFPTEHLYKPVAIENHSHTTLSVNMIPVRHYYVVEGGHDEPELDKGFIWMVKRFDEMHTSGMDINYVINVFASIVYDKYDVFDVEDGEVVVDPGLRNLRVYPHIQNKQRERISHFVHARENFPFLSDWINAGTPLLNFPVGTKFEFKTYPEGKIESPYSLAEGPKCHSCNRLLYGLIYLKQIRNKFHVYCRICPHTPSFADKIFTPSYTSRAPGNIDTFMEHLNIPEFMREVYKEAEKKIEKIKIDDQVHPGQKIYQIGDKFIAVDDVNFDRFIYSPRALVAAKFGKIVNAQIIVVE